MEKPEPLSEEKLNEVVGYGPLRWAYDEYGVHVQYSMIKNDNPITLNDVLNFMNMQKSYIIDNEIAVKKIIKILQENLTINPIPNYQFYKNIANKIVDDLFNILKSKYQ